MAVTAIVIGFSDNPNPDQATINCSVTVAVDGLVIGSDADLYEMATRIGYSEIVQKTCGEPDSVYINSITVTGESRQTYPPPVAP